MVACPIAFHVTDNIVFGTFRRLSRRPVHLYSFLMEKLRSCIKSMIKVCNKVIITLALTTTYFIVCCYRVFYKNDKKRWIVILAMKKKKGDTYIEQTKHLW